jgi:DNA-binding response OmpR family regulator
MTKGLSLGADAYVTKPFSNAELVARIGELLQERGAPGGA